MGRPHIATTLACVLAVAAVCLHRWPFIEGTCWGVAGASLSAWGIFQMLAGICRDDAVEHGIGVYILYALAFKVPMIALALVAFKRTGAIGLEGCALGIILVYLPVIWRAAIKAKSTSDAS